MRNAFARSVTALAGKYPEMVLLTGDIGNRLFDSFKEEHPGRFFNCGVAEAGMTGIAAGMASCGMLPITYTIAPFNVLRCLEQIRNDVCYPDLPVIIVGTGAGLSYANLGPTHHTMEDIGLLRTMPNMHVVCPADAMEVELAVEDALRLRRPTYIRLGKKNEPAVHGGPVDFTIGKGITLREGDEVALIGVGTMVATALECAEALAEKGISAKVVDLHTVKPLDEELLEALFAGYERIGVIEEHGLACGAGSAILEFACARRLDARKVVCFGGPDKFYTQCDKQPQARESCGLCSAFVVSSILELMEK